MTRQLANLPCAKDKKMLGAIAGDVIGSVFEGSGSKTTDFPLLSPDNSFTDDTVLTVAIASAILDQTDYAESLRRFGCLHPNRPYGGTFRKWLDNDSLGPYNSWGNGSAMRVSPVGWAFDSVENTLLEAKRSADVTHNHSEGVRGAQAVALSIYLARRGAQKIEIRREITARFGYDLKRTADEIRPAYEFDVSCQGSVPESIICFLDSDSFEHSIRLAISLGGDADTMACIAGAIAEAYYGGVPQPVESSVRGCLTSDLLAVVDRFRAKYCSPTTIGQ
jgi:ADP-ribosylglycohydrolase